MGGIWRELVCVQPVLLELDRETEEAAASLGANNWIIFTRVVLPALLPSLLSGAGLAFSASGRLLVTAGEREATLWGSE